MIQGCNKIQSNSKPFKVLQDLLKFKKGDEKSHKMFKISSHFA